MKEKIVLIVCSIYIILIGFISPIWVGLVYMSITGHGKGYSYDLGSEADISIFMGSIGLLLWIVAIVPILILTCKRMRAIHKGLILVPIAIFVICFVAGVSSFGLTEFLRCFNVVI